MNGERIIRDAIIRAGCTCTAVIAEHPNAWDFAVSSQSSVAAVVRCVDKLRIEDCLALKTMIAQGDFTKAFLVYTEEGVPPAHGEIPVYPLSRIDELAAALARECAP